MIHSRYLHPIIQLRVIVYIIFADVYKFILKHRGGKLAISFLQYEIVQIFQCTSTTQHNKLRVTRFATIKKNTRN